MVNEEGIPWTGILREWTEGVVIAHTEEPVPIFWVSPAALVHLNLISPTRACQIVAHL